VIEVLLGESAIAAPQQRFPWRRFRWALLVIPLLGLVVPLSLWLQYQSLNVTSKNAAVRGNLTEIGTRLSGLVASVEVDDGDRVLAGQVLARLSDRHILAEVQEARAKVEGLETDIEVERLSIELERQQIKQQHQEMRARIGAVEAQVASAQIEVDDARRNYEMRKALHDADGAISTESLLDSKSDQQKAEARLKELKANLAAARSGQEKVRLTEDALVIRERRLGSLEADLLSAKARLMGTEADLEGAVIRAPADGAVVRRIIQPGGSVEVGQPIISMWLGNDVWIEAWIDEEDIGFVKLGSKAMVTLHSFPGRDFEGVVDKIGLATDLEIPESEVPQPRNTRMSGAPVVGVRIRLDDPPLDLLPGLSAVVAIERKE
jgi:membrane fusion protein (multidrug efflux system)